MNSKYDKWTQKNIENLIKFIKLKEAILIRNFYKNITEGSHRTRKPTGFFLEMSKYTKKSPQQCKSKFQKLEKKIYTNYLQIPTMHYYLYTSLRFSKTNLNTKAIETSENSNHYENETCIPSSFKLLRFQIIECVKKFGTNLHQLRGIV